MGCVVADHENKLIGIVTDSDVRRLLLVNYSLEMPIGDRFNPNPVVGSINHSPDELFAICHESGVREIPLCDSMGRICDVFILNAIPSVDSKITLPAPAPFCAPKIENAMFLLAGGKGTRLKSVVADRPKPLAVVGSKPIIQTIIERASAQGIQNFIISLNHMANLLEEHLAAPCYSRLKIRLVHEPKPLGTAGSIGLARKFITKPLLVSNADVLTTVAYQKILSFHDVNKADITCVVRPHEVAVPFGVLDIQDQKIVAIREKPNFTYFVNAGIYVLNPSVCELIPEGGSMDMPNLMSTVMEAGGKVLPFLAHEYWVDVGQPADFHKANDEFRDHFGE